MFGTQQQSDGYGIGLFFKIFLLLLGFSGLVYSSSFAFDKWNDDERIRLTRNNQMLVKDNKELREREKQLTDQLAKATETLDKIEKAMEDYKK